MFLRGHGSLTTLENAVVGPFIAIISFVCSIGNVPLAAALWKGGISFGGVVSFIFADLITMPLLVIYRKLYGARMALRMLGVFWCVMSLAGLATEAVFRLAGLVPTARPSTIAASVFPGAIRASSTFSLSPSLGFYGPSHATAGGLAAVWGTRPTRVRDAGRDSAGSGVAQLWRKHGVFLLRSLP